jgi:hypothetical protein
LPSLSWARIFSRKFSLKTAKAGRRFPFFPKNEAGRQGV